jgi:hypothetical protein
MSNKSKTKKNNKIFYKRKKRFYTKKIGGTSEDRKEDQKEDRKEDRKEDQKEEEEAIQKIKKEVEIEKKQFASENNILAKTKDVALNMAAKTVDKVEDLLGVDLTDPNLVEKNKQEIQQLSKNAAEVGNLIAESVEPFAKPLIDKSINASEKILSKVGETGAKVMLNTATSIPGIGAVVGTYRSLGNLGDAIVSTVNTGSQLVTSVADTINASKKNFDRLLKEKEDILNRTKASIDEFTGGTRSYKLKKKVGTCKISKKNKR